MFQFHLISKISIFNLYQKFPISNDIKNLVYLQMISQNLRKFKICVQNILICIVYMQGELNISSIYRFMLSVSCIEELDISSLCDTCV